MRCFKDVCIAISAVLGVLLLFEVGLRATGAKYESSLYESDPILYMALRPNSQGWEAKEGENFVKINSWGMRDEEHTLAPSPGTKRIALLGDSMIAAAQVPLEKTMAKVLEAKLQGALGPGTPGASMAGSGTSGSGNRPVEVLNFGVGGYTLAQEF